MLIPIYKDHKDRIKGLIGNGCAAGNLEGFEISMKHLEQFLTWKYKINDMQLRKLTLPSHLF